MVLGKVLIEPLSLFHRSRKAVQDKTSRTIGLRQPVGYHLLYQFVGNEFPAFHENPGLLAELGALADVVAQDVARRNLRNPKVRRDPLGLSALAGTRCAAQQNDFLGKRTTGPTREVCFVTDKSGMDLVPIG